MLLYDLDLLKDQIYIDHDRSFTRWAKAIPIRNQEASTVADKLMEQIFWRFGMPRQILTDQGSNFECKLFQELCKRMEIDKIRTTAYRPSGNRMADAESQIGTPLTARAT